MEASRRIELALERTLAEAGGGDCPSRLLAAMRHALFPGGARIRPRLCLGVAEALGEPRPELSLAAAVAVEFLHCASLVHDDLPCFDDALLRRGQPSVQRAFGEATAVLVGDGLIVLAFEALGRAGAAHPTLLPPLVGLMAQAAGPARGLIAGQAWESEPEVDLERYHQAKSAALFEASTAAGALASGAPPEDWAAAGRLLGRAYQLADDLADALGEAGGLGKAVGRDAALGRPNACQRLGPAEALRRLDGLVEQALASLPAAGRRAGLEQTFRDFAGRLCPPELRLRCAAG
jgi:geranylgeranyl diphosphate synthase, type II